MSLTATPTYSFTTTLNVSAAGVTLSAFSALITGTIADTGAKGYVGDISFDSSPHVDWTSALPAGITFEAYVASGDLVEGVTYVVRENDITYNAATIAEDATFVATATTTYTGTGKVYTVTNACYWFAAYNPDTTAIITVLAKYTDEQVIGIIKPGKTMGPILLERGIKIKTSKVTEGTLRVFLQQY